MRKSNRDELKIRVAKAKPLLPGDYKRRVLERQPKYDTARGISRLNNVMSLVSADEELTIILEEIAQEYQGGDNQASLWKQ